MKATIEDTKLVQEKYKNLLEQARKDVLTKQSECDELRNQVNKTFELQLSCCFSVKLIVLTLGFELS